MAGRPTERAYQDVNDKLKPAVEAIAGPISKPVVGEHAVRQSPADRAPTRGCAVSDNVDGGSSTTPARCSAQTVASTTGCM